MATIDGNAPNQKLRPNRNHYFDRDPGSVISIDRLRTGLAATRYRRRLRRVVPVVPGDGAAIAPGDASIDSIRSGRRYFRRRFSGL